MADHPIFAAVYDRVMASAEARWLGEAREELLSRATGAVLEIGGGTGANLRYYPPAVTSLDICEPDGAMRRRLAPRAEPRARIHDCGIPGLPFDNASFDTVVSTLVLCTVPDVDHGLRDLRRVLKPDGRLLFIEHVRVPGTIASVQHALTPLWSHIAGGCHLDRDTIGSLREAGFVIADCRRHFRGLVVIGSALVRAQS
jgi:SAM-dependent methyltransferase